MQAVDRVDVAEAIAAKHALNIALKAGLKRAILETNCITLAHHLQKGRDEPSEFGSMVKDILHVVSNYVNITFSHVRSGDIVAHNMTKLSRYNSEMLVWLEEVPYSIHEYVMHDISILNE
ncbi:Dihydroorotase [Bienertia sinuspersici]